MICSQSTIMRVNAYIHCVFTLSMIAQLMITPGIFSFRGEVDPQPHVVMASNLEACHIAFWTSTPWYMDTMVSHNEQTSLSARYSQLQVLQDSCKM